jgi:hypothetical protein
VKKVAREKGEVKRGITIKRAKGEGDEKKEQILKGKKG